MGSRASLSITCEQFHSLGMSALQLLHPVIAAFVISGRLQLFAGGFLSSAAININPSFDPAPLPALKFPANA